MNDPALIWRLGRWIARRENGAVRFVSGSGELLLRVREGKIVAAEGIDPQRLAAALDERSADCAELLEEARELSVRHQIPETQAVGSAKELVQEALRSWFIDPDRQLEIVEGEPDAAAGPTISITHAIVELALSDLDQKIAAEVLPSLEVLLRRSASFLDLYAPLRLSEEADLIVAKITGQRTAGEICARSPHAQEEVLRLLAALVATGMLEAVPVVSPVEEIDILPTERPLEEVERRRIPLPWVAAAIGALVVLLGGLGYLTTRDGRSAAAVADGQGHWALVVDMGCEPEELQRILKKAREHPDELRPVAANPGHEDSCWRLVWGRFATRVAAEGGLGDVPASLVRDGFEPHPIELPAGEEAATDDPDAP